jgi:hypothetical protein
VFSCIYNDGGLVLYGQDETKFIQGAYWRKATFFHVVLVYDAKKERNKSDGL